MTKEEYKHQWYLKNKERILEKHKEYYKNNKELINNKKKDKYQENKLYRANILLKEYNRADVLKGRGIGDITPEWIVDNIFSKPCAHCGKEGWEVIGCNRLDNSLPHTMDNVEPCCRKCNSKNNADISNRDNFGKFTN